MTNSVQVTGWVYGDPSSTRDAELITCEFQITLRSPDWPAPGLFVPVWCHGPTAIEAGRLADGDRVEVTGCLSARVPVRTVTGREVGRVEVIAYRLAVPVPPEPAPDAHLEASYEDRYGPDDDS